MSDKNILAEEDIKEFYYNIGLLSTKFSQIEYNTLCILGLLIADDLVLTNTVLEKNSLHQNLDLLRKLNRYRQFEEDTIRVIISKISEIKSYRNLFIHGLWDTPIQKENDLVITCAEPKVKFDEMNNGKRWSNKRLHTFRLSYIKMQVQILDDIILKQSVLIEKLKSTENLFM